MFWFGEEETFLEMEDEEKGGSRGESKVQVRLITLIKVKLIMLINMKKKLRKLNVEA